MAGKRTKGNTLALTVSIVGVIVVALAFVMINYGQFFLLQKEAQTAIDAAALQAASDIGRVVIDGRFGKVALVDQPPKDGDFNKRSVLGINTILGTIRLDLLIAQAVGNTTMIFAARQDLLNAQEDAAQLNKIIAAAIEGTAQAADRDGNAVDIKGNALRIYNANSRRAGNSNRQLVPGSLRLTLGALSGNGIEGVTNIPTPQPSSADPISNDDRFTVKRGDLRYYRPYVAVPAPAGNSSVNITFVAVADDPRLVPNRSFVANHSGLALSVVQASADEAIVSIASDGAKKIKGIVRVVATAQAGGRRVAAPSGGLAVQFDAGIPANTQNVDFTSVRSIMNSSQLPANAGAGTPSPKNAWEPTSDGLYYQARGGPVGGSGKLVEQAYLGRQKDNPSISLALFAYTWLRSLGLRPNVQAVKNALSVNLRQFSQQNLPANPATIARLDFCPAAFAGDVGDAHPILGVAANPIVNGVDVRTLGDMSQEDLQRFANASQVGVPPGMQANGWMLAVDPSTGQTTTVGGDNFAAFVAQLTADLKATFTNAQETLENASQVFNQALPRFKELQDEQSIVLAQIAALEANHKEDKDELKSLKERAAKLEEQIKVVYAQVLRGELVMANATDALNQANSLNDNRANYSALGAQRDPSTGLWTIAGQVFDPVNVAASVADIRDPDLERISTGQKFLNQGKGWLTPVGEFIVLSTQAQAQAANIVSQVDLMQPALAASSVSVTQNFRYYFTVKGDASNPSAAGAGEIKLTNFATPFLAGYNLLEGQMIYQNPRAITVVKDGVSTTWQVVARANSAYAGLDENNKPTTYFNDTRAPGAIDRPEVKCAVQWQLLCPLAGGGACPVDSLVIAMDVFWPGMFQGYAKVIYERDANGNFVLDRRGRKKVAYIKAISPAEFKQLKNLGCPVAISWGS